MKKVSKFSFTFFLLVMALSIPVCAENQSQSMDGWQMRLMPYFWMPSMDAESTVNGLSGNVELDADDIIDDYLDFAAMGRVEAWKDKWGLTFDGVFMNLGADGTFEGSRGIVTFDMDADVRLGMADFGLAYRLIENQFGQNNEQRLTWEPYGGLRYAYLKQRIDLNVDIANIGSVGRTLGTSEDWVEPFIGSRRIWDRQCIRSDLADSRRCGL